MEPSDAQPTVAEEPRAPRITPSEIFLAFSGLALSGFGGVMPFAYRALVDRRQWLSAREFASLLAFAQMLPGPTIGNLSVLVGQRHAGFPGACAALAGMVAGPSCIVIALGVAWQHFGSHPAVARALVGMSAVAIGLLLATAVKMAVALFKPDARGAAEAGRGPVAATASAPFAASAPFTASVAPRDVTSVVPRAAPAEAPTTTASPPAWWTMRRTAQMALCALAFAGVGLLRWPLVAVVVSLAPFAIALSWFSDR